MHFLDLPHMSKALAITAMLVVASATANSDLQHRAGMAAAWRSGPLAAKLHLDVAGTLARIRAQICLRADLQFLELTQVMGTWMVQSWRTHNGSWK